MIRTLQFYVGRELFKTFALTAVGLTLTFSLCGGVLNMIQAEVLTAVQVARILGFILPIAATLTLPVAALFACAMVYGRLAADNEFDACKASGINILRLLVPAFLLSIVTAVFTYGFANYLIPTFIRQLDALVAKDIHKVFFQTLRSRGHFKFRDFVLYTDRIGLFEESEELKSIRIRGAAFLELEQGGLARCGTARDAQVDFRIPGRGAPPQVEAVLTDVRMLDVRRHELFDTREQRIEPSSLPSRIELKPKWLTLPDLLKYRLRPLELPSIQDDLLRVQWLIWEARFYRHLYEEVTDADRTVRLGDDRVQYTLTAQRARLDPDTFRLALGKVAVQEVTAELNRRYTAESAEVQLARSTFGREGTYALISLRERVIMTDAADPGSRIEQAKRELDPVSLPGHWPGITDPVSPAEMLGEVTDPARRSDPLPSLGLSARVDDARIRLRKKVIELWHEIEGIIHSRLAFSASSLVVLVLAAGLGIILRGGQLLSAFIISFVPGLLVVVANIMGRSLSEKPETYLLGIGVIWGGIVLLAVADVIVLTRYLRR